MSQTSVTRFFHTKKRGIEEDSALNAKNKVICLERSSTGSFTDAVSSKTKVVHPTIEPSVQNDTPKASAIRHDLTSQRMTRSRRKASQDSANESGTPKIVNFFKMGNLSPMKKAKSLVKETIKEETEVPQTVPANDGMVTPTKQGIPAFNPQNSPIVGAAERLKSRLNNMTTDEIKKKLKKSTKLADLKTTLNKLQSGLDRMDQLEQKRMQAEEFKLKRLSNQNPGPADQSPKLKAFKNIELEIVR
jgi:chromatin licensing and DNA replication factor 1